MLQRRGEGQTEEEAEKLNSSHGLRKRKIAAVALFFMKNLITNMMRGDVSSPMNVLFVGLCLLFKTLVIFFEGSKRKGDIFPCP